MSPFGRKRQSVSSPWGEAEIHENIATICVGRFRGVCIDLVWRVGNPPSEAAVRAILDHLSEHWDAALAFLKIQDFPRSLRIVAPESISFEDQEGEWTMTFSCPNWEDGYWRVFFKEGVPIRHEEGD